MIKELFKIDRTKLGTKHVIDDLKEIPALKLSSVTYDNTLIYSIEDLRKYVYILPFVKDGDTLKYIMATKIHSPLDGSYHTGLPCYEQRDSDATPLDTVYGFLTNILKLPQSIIETERIFYLGGMKSDRRYKYSIPCYAVNLTKLIKEKDTAFVCSDYEVILKRRYTEVMNSGSNDPCLYAAMYLLMTYYQ